MVLLISMLFGIQALCSWAASPPAREGPTALLSPTCDDTAVEEAADLALRQINADRKEGYILSLYRIFSVREQPQRTHLKVTSLYQMLHYSKNKFSANGEHWFCLLSHLGCSRYRMPCTQQKVVEELYSQTCSYKLLSAGKGCKASMVYGQCKAIIYINQARNIAHLNTYECTLQPVPPRYIWMLCPDCPVDDNPTEPRYLEAAVQSLAKFNEESEQTHYFSVLNVTRASMQWVVGPAYFVEFLIQETSCSKNDTTADISKCKPLSSELAQIGFCKGSVVNSRLEHEQFVTISCEIYSVQDPATEEGKQQDNKTPGKSSQNHQQAFPSEVNPFSPHVEKTVGWVKILPPSNEDTSFQNLPESQIEHKDGKPVPPGAVGSMPSLDREKTQADKPDLTKPVTGPGVLPFPEELSLSDSCPGEAKKINSIIQPLLPKKPTKA